ncbi:hypothetical protein PTSG_04623 [Salpingoeca rosetta]|uniref:Ubiquilin n=1 Tax=Salpingoeca rosetta (strain ATCC 50818 / BSB-021) TaxID=946362 RepID=F2U7Y9_SALR5|nr:uncharacterized protein PTSG_04623 [Salpingoeca rosetta]EGD72894.1 hypothetical protein PTSG_04623 [Salpingoeca rosetta]|eukprot:XP_004994716.1 hypothetical protein PTSG_04623 [Salpingoeca rosetta]
MAYMHDTSLLEAALRLLKELIAAETDIPADEQRIVYSGKILKDTDELRARGFRTGHTLHVVRGGDFMAQMMESPMMQQMVDQMMSNPEMMEGIVRADPRLRTLLDQNPELRQAMRDPQIMRQSLAMARNPRLREEFLRQQDRAISNLEAMPGGFNHLRRITRDVIHPMEDAMRARGRGGGDDNGGDDEDDEPNAFDALFADDDASSRARPNEEALPNPWSSAPQANQQQQQQQQQQAPPNPFAGLFGSPFGPSTGAANGTSSPSSAQQQQQQQQQGGFPFGGFMPPSMMTGQWGWPSQQQQQQQSTSTTAPTGSTQPATTGATTPSAPTPGAPGQAPSSRYSSELQQLQDMGFTDEAANIAALQATNGNVHLAVQRLLGQ